MNNERSKYHFHSPHQMHPLLPSGKQLDELRPLAAEVISRAKDLSSHGMPHLRILLRETLRPMNSFYTNKIEGQQEETKSLKVETAAPLAYLGTVQSMERTKFKGMTGLASRTADRALADLFKLGVITSKTPKGPVELALPLHLFRHLFPRLWPEAETNTL